MKKIGIFSGTFDPVHAGHLAFAKQAIKTCKLDKVWFLPEPKPRRKQGVKAFEHRVKMVQLAVKSNPQFGSIVIEQARFTPHETMPVLTNRFKNSQLFMLMGEDMLGHLADWPHIKDLVGAVHLIVGCRHSNVSDVKRLLKNLNKTRGLNFTYTAIKADYSHLSSKEVRSALRRGELPDDVPLPVARYLIKQELYTPKD